MSIEFLVNIDVGDLERAVTFYLSAFGFRVGRSLGPSIAELVGASTRVYLLAKAEGSQPFAGATSPRSFNRHWTPVHLDIVVANVEAASSRALAAGATSEGNIETHAWGRIAIMADPFGNGFCLIEFLNRGYDELEGRT